MKPLFTLVIVLTSWINALSSNPDSLRKSIEQLESNPRAVINTIKNNQSVISQKADSTIFYDHVLGKAYRLLAKHDSAFQLQYRVLNEYQGDSSFYSSVLIEIGTLHYYTKNNDSALFYFKSSHRYSEENGDSTMAVFSLFNVGSIYYEMGFYRQALNHFLRSKRYQKKDSTTNSLFNLATFHNNVGLALKALQRLDEAKISLNKSLSISESNGFVRNANRALYNLSLLNYDLGNYAEAQANLSAINRKVLSPELDLNIKCHQANLLLMAGQGNKAYKLLTTLDTTQTSWPAQSKADYLIALAKSNLNQKNLSQSEKNLQLAWSLDIDSFLKKRLEISELLYDTYKLRGDTSMQLQWLTISKKLQQEFFEENIDREISDLTSSYLFDTEKQARLQAEEKASISEENLALMSQRNTIIFVASGILVILILIMFYTYILYSKRTKLVFKNQLIEHKLNLEKEKNKRLELQNKGKEQASLLQSKEAEIAKLLMNVSATKDFKSKVKKEIEQAGIGSGTKAKLKKILSETKQHQIDWTDLCARFDETHVGFLDRLSNQYSLLTANDKRLIMLLKMNLSTKEMAAVLNISEKSCEVAKYRLRKKLNLPKGKNISVLINSI